MLIKFREKISKKYDVIVIGSGLAGMTASNKLARNGRKVLLLEAHNKLGGFATWFKRQQGDHIFDVSLHGFPVGMIKTCKKYWSREIANRIVKLSTVRIVNPQFEVETDFTKEDYTRILVEQFKVDEKTVQAFYDRLANMNYYDDQSLTNRELFEEFFPGRSDVVRLLLEPIVYANGSTLEDPAITYGIVFSNFMNKGVYTYIGGTDHLVGEFKQELLKNGVDIKLHSPVDKICIEDGRATAVVVKGERIEADAVISNSNIINTVRNLVGDDKFSDDFLQKSKDIRLNTSSCQVYMGIKSGETIPNIGDLLFYSEDKEFSSDSILSTKVTSQTFSFYYPEMRPQLKNRYAVVSSSNARYEDWVDLSYDEYEKRKQYLCENALSALEKFIPGVRDKIDYIEAATPKTFERYTGHMKGASFGTKFEGLDVSMNLHKEIPGLFHSGSVGIIMSGWLGAANYGIIQAHAVENFLD